MYVWGLEWISLLSAFEAGLFAWWHVGDKSGSQQVRVGMGTHSRLGMSCSSNHPIIYRFCRPHDTCGCAAAAAPTCAATAATT